MVVFVCRSVVINRHCERFYDYYMKTDWLLFWGKGGIS